MTQDTELSAGSSWAAGASRLDGCRLQAMCQRVQPASVNRLLGLGLGLGCHCRQWSLLLGMCTGIQTNGVQHEDEIHQESGKSGCKGKRDGLWLALSGADWVM